MQGHVLKALTISAVSALVLTGCAYEFIEADGQCAEVTSTTYPDFMIDLSGDVSSDIPVPYFDFTTEGSFQDVFVYASLPSPAKAPFIADLFGGEGSVEFDDLSDAAFPVDRYTTSLDVTDSSPHRVTLGDIDPMVFGLLEFGIGFPFGVVTTCDLTNYNSQLVSASPSPSASGFYETNLVSSSTKQLYPGYDADFADVQIQPGGVVDIAFDRSLNLEAANVVVLPWVDAFGPIDEANFETKWWATLAGINSASSLGDSSDVIYESVESPASQISVEVEGATYDFMSNWVLNTYGPFSGGEGLIGAIVLISTFEYVDNDTIQLRYAYEFAEFGADGTLGGGSPVGTDYDGPQYKDDQLKGKPGEQVTLIGSNMKVNSAQIGGQNARIISNTSTSLTLEIPAGLAGGQYDVHYTFDGGEVTRQLGAHVIDHSVWTKRFNDTQAKLYAKNVAGAGKVQFMLNGREVAWVNAIDASDPKLRKANGAHYLVRTVELKSGKNVLEIWVDGIRERRTVYTR